LSSWKFLSNVLLAMKTIDRFFFNFVYEGMFGSVAVLIGALARLIIATDFSTSQAKTERGLKVLLIASTSFSSLGEMISHFLRL
jgi:hypothetical protein